MKSRIEMEAVECCIYCIVQNFDRVANFDGYLATLQTFDRKDLASFFHHASVAKCCNTFSNEIFDELNFDCLAMCNWKLLKQKFPSCQNFALW